YQAMRVNRLIMESILPEHLLKRGKYLGVQGVVQQIFAEVEAEYFDSIWVYGHPAHQDWCVKLCRDFLKGKKVALKGAEQDTLANWDTKTAQVWCKSLENWQVYITIGKNK
ncbi:MAG: hypothetical protein AAF696_19615, partial [Bacteroidota bacterium]